MARSNLDMIHDALEAGLSLSVWDERGRERRFIRGQITREANARGSVRTTHLDSDCRSYVRLTKAGITSLAKQARERLAHKDEILAREQNVLRAAMGRD